MAATPSGVIRFLECLPLARSHLHPFVPCAAASVVSLRSTDRLLSCDAFGIAAGTPLVERASIDWANGTFVSRRFRFFCTSFNHAHNRHAGRKELAKPLAERNNS